MKDILLDLKALKQDLEFEAHRGRSTGRDERAVDHHLINANTKLCCMPRTIEQFSQQ